jgi:hypothetical protein
MIMVDFRLSPITWRKEEKKMKMKSLVVIISVVMGFPTLAAASQMSSAANFSLASYDGNTVSGCGMSFGMRFPNVQLRGKKKAVSNRVDVFVVATREEFETAHLSSAGQYIQQPLLAPISTRTKGYILLGAGAAMIVGGFVLHAATKNSDNDETQLAGAVGSYILIGVGAFAIYKGLAILILPRPDKYEVSGRRGSRHHGGLRAGVRVSF